MPMCLKNICVDMSLPGIEQVAFSKIKGITPETAGAILAAVGSEAEFFRMSERELAELAGSLTVRGEIFFENNWLTIW